MSNIYIQEPPTDGKILLQTSVGDIDIELWSKETPRASRNFVQLCMEGYYNGTIFHRLVKDFIVQGGDPTGTGEGGESIYGKPFRDEFHSRLRFVRRGLIAMANGGPHDNGSQFFFTLAPAPELERKHTIFGKVVGNTLYNMLKLTEAEVDENDRPAYPHKILKCQILHNPFEDIVPRVLKDDKDQEKKQKKSKSKATKNFSLLSFGEEAEEDEEETNKATKAMKGKSKSSHDLLDDPKLSSVAAVEKTKELKKRKATDSDSSEESSEDEVDKSKEKIKKKHKKEEKVDDQKEKEEKKPLSKSEEYRKEARQLKKELLKPKTTQVEIVPEKEKPEKIENMAMMEYKKETEKYREVKKKQAKKGSAREEQTLALLAKFQSKLTAIASHEEEEEEEEDTAEKDDSTMSWLGHKLSFENSEKAALDANVNELDRYEIFDPRNPLTKRRREASKQSSKDKL